MQPSVNRGHVDRSTAWDVRDKAGTSLPGPNRLKLPAPPETKSYYGLLATPVGRACMVYERVNFYPQVRQVPY